MLGAMSAAALCRRSFQISEFRTSDRTWRRVAKRAAVDALQAKVIHRRPALIQELEWRPQPLGRSSQREAVQDVVFSFYDGKLFRIVVDYDRYETEGLTVEDFVDAISATYGPATRPTAPVQGCAGQLRRSGRDSRPMAGFAVPLRSDPCLHTGPPSGWSAVDVEAWRRPLKPPRLEAKRLDDQRSAPKGCCPCGE